MKYEKLYIINCFSFFFSTLFWNFHENALRIVKMRLDYCNNNYNAGIHLRFLKKEKKNHLSFFKYSPKSFKTSSPPPSSNIRNSTAREAGWTVYPSPSALCFHKSQRGRALQEWAGAGAPTVTLAAPVAATLASFLLPLFSLSLFVSSLLFPLSFQHPFLRWLATSSFHTTS